MKKLFFPVLVIISTTHLHAQNVYTVQYTETRALHINFQGDAAPPPDMPKEFAHNTVLYIDDSVSLYKNAPEQPETPGMDDNDGGQHFHMHFAPPENQVYTDYADSQMTSLHSFMERDFLVDGHFGDNAWKLTGKQKMLLNYPCLEATRQVDSATFAEVWFTPLIAVPAGPSSFNGLPGLILEVNVNNGDLVIEAVSVNNSVDATQIVKPDKGKKVSEEEYEQIVEEKRKEMGDQGGPGGTIMIRINH